MSESGPSARRVSVPRARAPAPGEMLALDAGGHGVLLANVDGRFHAVDDLCSHEDARLSDGALQGGTVKCPLHGSRFDLETGQPLEEPAEEPVRCHRVRVTASEIIIEIVAGDDR